MIVVDGIFVVVVVGVVCLSDRLIDRLFFCQCVDVMSTVRLIERLNCL